MDCNFTTIKTCELKDSTFRSRILDFGDFDISDYTFSVVYKAGFDQIISEQELTAIGNILTVPLEAIEGASNRAKAEVWMLRDGGFKDKVIVFDVVISATGCPSDSTVTDGVSVTFGGLTVPVEVNQGIVNISREVAFSTLTEEEKIELKGSPGAPGSPGEVGPPGPQGDPLTFSDLTPQQVNELKQPAIEAADLANQAATNANTAAGLASDATVEAVNATGQAIAATAQAENAAEAANEAAQNAITGISGEATEANSPELNGFHRYIVTTPITTNSAWGIEVTQAELDDNWVFFNVRDGVITKDSKPQKGGKSAYQLAVEAGFIGTESEWRESLNGADGKGVTSIAKTSTVGEVDTYTITYSDATTSTFTVTNGNTAKLPLYSAIKSGDIAEGTQFIDDENSGVQYMVLAGQTLNVGELPADFIDVKVSTIGGANLEFKTTDKIKFDRNYKISLVLNEPYIALVDLTGAKDGMKVLLDINTNGKKLILPAPIKTTGDEIGLGSYLITLEYMMGSVFGHVISKYPKDAYFLREFTQAEINYGKTQSDYLVLRHDVSVQYPFQLTLPSNTTFDSTECTIDCFHDTNNVTARNMLFHQTSTENTIFKCGVIIGDKYKRAFTTDAEKWVEQTYFINAQYGAQNIEFSCIESSGFMGDTIGGNQYGIGHVVWAPQLTKADDGFYYSPFYNLAAGKGNLIAIYGGVGYTRFPTFNFAKLRFKNSEGEVISTIDTEYLEHVQLPMGATSVQLIVAAKEDDDLPAGTKRTEDIQIVQHPAHTTIIKDSYFRDHHRGSISNVSNDTFIVNCTFEDTDEYDTKPRFPSSTRYAINPEDAVANYVHIEGNTFKNKFHTILLAAVKKAVVTNNVFIGNNYNLVVYQNRHVEFTHNKCTGGIIHISANPLYCEVAYNEFNAVKVLGQNIHDNVFTNGSILGVTRGEGAFNNVFENSGWNYQEGTNWQNVRNNIFKNHKSYFVGYTLYPIIQNTFIDTEFTNLQGTYAPDDIPTFADCIFERHIYHTNSRKISDAKFFDCSFKDSYFYERYLSLLGNNTVRHFYDCTIELNRPFIENFNNQQGSHIYYYFKDCIITADTVTNFVSTGSGSNTIHVILDNCTVDANITFPTTSNTWGDKHMILTYETIPDDVKPIID